MEMTWKDSVGFAIFTLVFMVAVRGAYVPLLKRVWADVQVFWQKIVDARTEKHNQHLTLAAVQAVRVVRTCRVDEPGKHGTSFVHLAEGDVYARLPATVDSEAIVRRYRTLRPVPLWGCSNPTRRNIPEAKILRYYRRGLLEACTTEHVGQVLRRTGQAVAWGAIDLSDGGTSRPLPLANGGTFTVPETPGSYLISVSSEPTPPNQWAEAALELSRANMQPEAPRTSLSEALDTGLIKPKTKKELLNEDPFGVP